MVVIYTSMPAEIENYFVTTVAHPTKIWKIDVQPQEET
jgi:hypothetical protein